MKKVDALIDSVGLSEVVVIRRDEYHEARFEYEMSLRRFLNDAVNNCPCCFKGFYKEAEKALTVEMIKEGVEPNDLEVLEEMRSKAELLISNLEHEDSETIH